MDAVVAVHSTFSVHPTFACTVCSDALSPALPHSHTGAYTVVHNSRRLLNSKEMIRISSDGVNAIKPATASRQLQHPN